jgi:predicted nucleotidyltransferase
MLLGMTIDDPILLRFRTAIREVYGPRIERLVLYGSRARGDARSDSDYDIAVFLADISSRWEEFRKLADIELELLDDTGVIVHSMPYPAGSWRDRSSPLMHEIRRDGIDL